jgi:hypothetical protein
VCRNLEYPCDEEDAWWQEREVRMNWAMFNKNCSVCQSLMLAIQTYWTTEEYKSLQILLYSPKDDRTVKIRTLKGGASGNEMHENLELFRLKGETKRGVSISTKKKKANIYTGTFFNFPSP